MSVQRTRWREAMVVVAIVLVLMTLFWWPLLTADVKPWEAGAPIPGTPPEEGNRVFNAAGFSIVAPPRWEARSFEGMIHLSPRQVFAGRSRAGINVLKGEQLPLDQTDFILTQFARQPAFLKREYRPSTFDDPALTTWTYLVQKQGHSYTISYFLAESRDEIPLKALEYLQTWQVEQDH